MRSDRDKRSDKELEIDNFLAQFDTENDNVEPDINSYLNDKPATSGKPTSRPDTKELIFHEPSFEPVPVKEVEPVKSRKERNFSETMTKVSNSGKKVAAGAAAFKGKVKNFDKKSFLEKVLYKENPNYDPNKGETYMLAGKKINNKPYILSIKKLLLDIIAVCVAIGLALMLYFAVCILLAPHYDFHDVYSMVDQSSVIYDDQGEAVDQVYYDQNRKITKYEEMPEDLINSFVALEDKTFWKHHGFNWIRMCGAVVSSVLGGGQISGTSTITQQLARNVYLADTKSVRSIKRKVMEMYYASRLEACLSKEEIVEAYLNTIYLGYGCYGVNSAAKSYFSKSVKDLNLLECASLAALPQAPDTYALVQCVDPTSVTEADTNIIAREPDTYIANDTAKFRRNICLDFMKEQGYIDESEYKSAYDKDLIDFINPTFNTGNGSNSYFHEYLVDTVIEDLMDQYGMEAADAERMVYTKGLKIYSTMDSTAQKTIVKEFANPANYPGVTSRTDADGNIISADGVLLLYDYDNFFDDKDNFKFKSEEFKLNDDGSLTIKRGYRLNIYTTEVGGETDYSVEFKQTYTYEDGVLYAIPGGYVNIPANYKSLDSNDDLVISADFFTDYPDAFKIKGKSVKITPAGYSLPQKTIQPQSAMVIVGVGTGEIKAMVGGRSTRGERLLNRATNPRQPGSSIKPLAVYGAALQKSFELASAGKKWDLVDYHIDKQGTKGYGDYITTHSSVADEKTLVNQKPWPLNSNNAYTGKNTFMSAIQQSINTCAFKIQMQVGTDYSIDMLHRFGLTTIADDASEEVNDLNPAALALGAMANGVKPLEMALAYSVFPAGGKLNTPICYTKVVDKNGEEILVGKSEQTSALDEGVAWIMRNVLQSVVTKGIAGSAYVTSVQSGGKTGTTDTQCDIWFDGFTPTYAASLWIGTDNNIPLTTMSGPAAALWGKIMRQLPAACTGTYLPQPENVIYKDGYYYTKGTEKGLASYAGDEEKKMKEEAEARAYEEWLIERENHKTWVDPVTHTEYQTVHHDAWDEEIVDDEGNVQIIHHEAYDTYEEVVVVDQEGYFKYDEGWGEDDFEWDGIIPDDIREKYYEF